MPSIVNELNLLDRVDYQDAYVVETPVHWTPEHWMRAIIEDAPRWFLLPWINLLGRGIMRARVGPLNAPGYVLGAKIIVDRADAFALGLDGAGKLGVRLITLTPPGQAVFATQIRFGALMMRTAWPAIRTGHRFFAPFLLSRAAQAMNNDAGSN
ncbi:hypothetical protein [Mycobacterium sp. 1274761.0]|uniref:hypothetical protein n=1 Tax=Mycobacterium sp. 1274761.0 TaxID=1834077 RepID=UPI0012E7ECF7|nr:hypothetical protein [Mycobacterium sp. 1274761.0]